MILSLDTGLQKTSVLAALLIVNKVKYPTGVSLVIIPPEANKNISIIKKWTPLLRHAVLHSEAGYEGRIPEHLKLFLDNADTVFISPKLLFSDDFVNLWNKVLKHKITNVLIDESHLLANPDTQSGYMLKYLAEHTKEMSLLTATPGDTFRQFRFLTGLCDKEMPYYSKSRKDLGLEGEFFVSVSNYCENDLRELYLNIDEPNRSHKYRAHLPSNSPLLTDIVNYAAKSDGSTCLIYTRHLEPQQVIADTLRSKGYDVAVINSSVSSEERKQIGQGIKFARPQIVLTTVTVAIDIPTTNIYLFGWCPDITQFVGRANREYRKKDLNIHMQIIDYEKERVKEALSDSIQLTEYTDKSNRLYWSILDKL